MVGQNKVGVVTCSSAQYNASPVITYLKPFKNTNYNLVITGRGSHDGNYTFKVGTTFSATQFVVWYERSTGVNNQQTCFWHADGYQYPQAYHLPPLMLPEFEINVVVKYVGVFGYVLTSEGQKLERLPPVGVTST